MVEGMGQAVSFLLEHSWIVLVLAVIPFALAGWIVFREKPDED